MAPKLWRQSYGAKGMHAFIDYHRFGICYHQMSSACGFSYLKTPCIYLGVNGRGACMGLVFS